MVPLSGRQARTVTLTRIGVVTVTLLSAGLLAFSGFAIVSYVFMEVSLINARTQLVDARRELKELRGAAERLSISARKFESVLSETMRQTGDHTALPPVPELGGLPLSWSPESGMLREVAVMERLAKALEGTVMPVARIGQLMENQGRVMNEIPNIWPIAGGAGHISMYFGQNEHPFSGQWYIHNGIDISTFRSGDQVLATADGKVVQTGYDSGFGYFVTLQHAHGFFTRYGHLQVFKVSRGQRVQQGQTLGLVGNTGKSTGPHLHYEVHLGTSVIDPLKFLNIRKTVQPVVTRTGVDQSTGSASLPAGVVSSRGGS